MRVRASIALCSCLLGAACELGGDVGQGGEYAFLPGSGAVDTVPYPLTHLLVVEDDAPTARTYVYLFSGQLGRAGVGLPDLRRIGTQSRGFQMAFETPRARYLDETIASKGEPRTLRMGEETFELARLDDAGLGQSGGARWLRSVASGDYVVRAYFGSVPDIPEVRGQDLVVEGEGVSFSPKLRAPELEAAIVDETLVATHAELEGADYKVIDLLQPIAERVEDEDGGVSYTETEAIVRVTVAASAAYAAGESLITDAAGQGCWSADEPLAVRLTQIDRSYRARGDGDLAVVHLRNDVALVDAAAWTELLGEPKAASYCGRYRPEE